MTSTLRNALTSISCFVAAGLGHAQTGQDATLQESKAKGSALPAGLRPVPGGVIEMGTSAKDLLAAEEKIFPIDQLRVRDIPRLLSELGTRTVQVEPFLMSENLVTMEQYKVFVEQTGHRYPYDWWRYGRQDDYESEARQKAMNAISATENKPLLYWQQNWKDLPWKIPTDMDLPGKPSMEKYPVIYVSWRDAVAFAAWAGMRLPTEAEWMFAATGGKRREFVWGDDPNGLKIQRGSINDKPWPVGHWDAKFPELTGPFGHGDLVLHVWEWTGDPGFFSFVDLGDYEKERDKLFKDKMFRDREDRDVQSALSTWPSWSGNDRVVKGGWYASTKTELRLATRAPQGANQTLGGVGFRLAKSMQPGRDIAASMIRLDYDSTMGGEKKPNIDDQVGIERYDLAENGLIKAYHAISVVPINFVSDDRKTTLARLEEDSMEQPVPLGTLVATDNLLSPAVDRGIYTITWRQRGMPKILSQALTAAKKELAAAARAKPKAEGEAALATEDKSSWRPVLERFGITDAEALAGNVDFVRLKPGDLKVTTEQHQFVLRDFEGKFVAACNALTPLELKSGYKTGDATMAVSEGKDGTENVEVTFGAPIFQGAGNRVYKVQMKLVLPKESAGGSSWRTSSTPLTTATNGGNGGTYRNK